MSYHAFVTACCPVIPTLVSVLYLLPFLVPNVWFCAVQMSGSMQFMALYQLADTASVDVTFFLDGSNYSNNQVMACLDSLVFCICIDPFTQCS